MEVLLPRLRSSRILRAVAGAAARLVGVLVTLLISSMVIFSASYLAGDPITVLLGGREPDPALIEALRTRYGLDQPLPVQYANWVGAILNGDLGQSLQYRAPVSGVLAARLPATLALLAFAFVIAATLGVALGVLAALNRGRAVDGAILVALSVLTGVPAFVAAVALIGVFAIWLGWFPSLGLGEGFWGALRHLTLPALALAGTFAALVGRVTRGAMIQELGKDHVAAASMRGVGAAGVLFSHTLRGVLPVLAPLGGLLVAGMLAASTIIEQSFGIPGIGSLLVDAIVNGDLAVVQATALTITVIILAVNLLSGAAETLLDPRRRKR